MSGEQQQSAQQYEEKYKGGYGLVYPESHLIRLHRHILEWELHLDSGPVFDFGCGAGAHLKYFLDHGFTPYGCDTSTTAVERCKTLMPEHARNFFVVPPSGSNLLDLAPTGRFAVFLANQVLYYLTDEEIGRIVGQAHSLVRPGGVFVASMMAYSCWYARCVTAEAGDFKRVELVSPRQQETMFINFKNRDELPHLFRPFRRLHIGSYGSHIRDEEGSTDHWLFVGIRD
ncbi:MAG: class I SAM-dependent methyltransferase [Kiritimatiellae bacterium]|nr:class I SAM-dependent methyltransferase [Kiritimatiellia bacterium]